ncbi:GRP family sugar transporter [Carnobacterium sp. ISL-102]|uniref:GRP family sugar transporter n=1 Tax=Carnobacterium sp. ISL-102 TaxID=2819142 RepID=UPI001BE88C78|nr:GRP family sugar transporter [Carnobacterium sp. ISL-102]MBT2732523.1 glucose transporter GlcU [Carnobacterium sp. ISL-102]
MEILIALIPAIAWGSIGLVSNKLGGNSYQQTVGMAAGAAFFAIGVYFVYQPIIDMKIILVGLFSGALWSLGQMQQFQSMRFIGVSNTLPISTGLQLIVNTLAGVLLFREWTSSRDIILGIIAIIILIFGVTFTTVTDTKETTVDSKGQKKAGAKALIYSTIGYGLYTITINAAGVDAMAVILPQAIGMLIGSLLFSAKQEIKSKYTVRNLLTGLLWATGNIFMLISMAKIGLAISFSLSQTGIIISTLGSIWFLGETKTKREFRYILMGCILVIVGGVLLGYIKA